MDQESSQINKFTTNQLLFEEAKKTQKRLTEEIPEKRTLGLFTTAGSKEVTINTAALKKTESLFTSVSNQQASSTNSISNGDRNSSSSSSSCNVMSGMS